MSGYLCCFQFVTVVNSTIVNSFTHLSLGKCVWIFIGHIPKSGIIGVKVINIFRAHIDRLLSRWVFNLSSVLFYQKPILVPDKTGFLNRCISMSIPRCRWFSSEESPWKAILI